MFIMFGRGLSLSLFSAISDEANTFSSAPEAANVAAATASESRLVLWNPNHSESLLAQADFVSLSCYQTCLPALLCNSALK
jgi:hypothetical protein